MKLDEALRKGGWAHTAVKQNAIVSLVGPGLAFATGLLRVTEPSFFQGCIAPTMRVLGGQIHA
eukprot:5211048-Pyramimonas_sp.AAC.1